MAAPAAPGQPPDLFDAIMNMIRAKDYLALGVYLLILYLPAILAAIHGWKTRRKIYGLYKELLSGKDAEIERQAQRIKDLENVLLKRPRK